ncbi:unnamed protein product, partial [Staurois parvus]
MGPYIPPPHAAARPLICHGPLYRLLMLLPGPTVSHGSLYGLPLLLSPSPTLCHVPLSGLLTLLLVPFCHRLLYGLPIAAASTATLWLTNTGFCWPVIGQMSEVCGDSKIDGTHLHVILSDSIISLPQQTPRAFKLKVQCSALIL